MLPLTSSVHVVKLGCRIGSWSCNSGPGLMAVGFWGKCKSNCEFRFSVHLHLNPISRVRKKGSFGKGVFSEKSIFLQAVFP